MQRRHAVAAQQLGLDVPEFKNAQLRLQPLRATRCYAESGLYRIGDQPVKSQG